MGNLFYIMGSCTSRDRVPVVDGAHAEENFCFASECNVKLHGVEFRSFQAAIKRFGYRMDLNQEHLKAIAPEIRLDYELMQGDEKSAQAIVYLDNKFANLNGKHNVENLTLIGWLLCRHWSDETQATELWHIINPTLAETVPQSYVTDVVKKLCYVAIDLNLRLLQALPESTEKTNALKYHKKIKEGQQRFMKNIANQMGRDVAREDLNFMEQLYRSYDLRMTVAGDKELDA